MVAVNHEACNMPLENAKGRTVGSATAGDLDAAFDNAVKAQATALAAHDYRSTAGTRGGTGSGPSRAGPSIPHAPSSRAANSSSPGNAQTNSR